MESGLTQAGEPSARTDAAAGSKNRRKPRTRFAGALLVALALLLTGAFGASGASAEPAASSSARYIVTFALGVDASQQTADIAAATATDVSAIPELRMHVIDASDIAAANLAASSDVFRVDADVTRS